MFTFKTIFLESNTHTQTDTCTVKRKKEFEAYNTQHEYDVAAVAIYLVTRFPAGVFR